MYSLQQKTTNSNFLITIKVTTIIYTSQENTSERLLDEQSIFFKASKPCLFVCLCAGCLHCLYRLPFCQPFKDINYMRLIPMRIYFLRRETGKVGLGSVFRPFMNSDQYRCQNKVTKMCPKYLDFELKNVLLPPPPREFCRHILS